MKIQNLYSFDTKKFLNFQGLIQDPLDPKMLTLPQDHEVSTHFLYRFLDGKKTTCSQFSVPGLLEIHWNLKKEKKNNSRESFFWISPFFSFFCIDPGFGGLWDKLWIFFLIAIFIMIQKNAFDNISISSKNFFLIIISN